MSDFSRSESKSQSGGYVIAPAAKKRMPAIKMLEHQT
jgi:hypothetical protein